MMKALYKICPYIHIFFFHLFLSFFLNFFSCNNKYILPTNYIIWLLSNHLILSVIPFSSCPQSFPASGFFPMSQLFTTGGQGIGASASASVLPMSIQGWFPLGLTGFIFLQSKGLSGVFSSTTIWKHQFFGTQPSLWSSSHICTLLLEKNLFSVILC